MKVCVVHFMASRKNHTRYFTVEDKAREFISSLWGCPKVDQNCIYMKEYNANQGSGFNPQNASMDALKCVVFKNGKEIYKETMVND